MSALVSRNSHIVCFYALSDKESCCHNIYFPTCDGVSDGEDGVEAGVSDGGQLGDRDQLAGLQGEGG